jgi:aminopeptidase
MVNPSMLNFAKVAIRKGVNIQKGQELIIFASLDQPEFIELLVKEAYVAGAKKVSVEWSYLPVSRLHSEYQSEETLTTFAAWQLQKYQYNVDHLPAQLHVRSDDPDGMKGVDQKKMTAVTKITTPVIMKYREQMDNRFQWSIIALPGKKWAKKVFPKLSEEKALAAMWKAILKATRVDGKDPIKEWDEHNAFLQDRSKKLDALNIDYLHYTSQNGTDFKVWMIPDARWLGGGATTLSKVFYNPNMPTEEVFITPWAGKAEGLVVATKPLSYRGELIEDFSVTFKDGKVVKVKAKKNQKLLEQMIAMDEGASKIGEIALVPFASPIQQSGILYYNTLFDENASCHLALGRAYTDSIRNFNQFSKEELVKKGCNVSMIHVDFMMGSKDLSIDAFTRDGKKVAIFKKGNWAF